MASPKNITTSGRLSFPTWTVKDAYALSLRGQYPDKDASLSTPSFQLLLNETQFEKVLAHFVEHFLPYCQQQFEKGGKKERDALTPADVKKLLATVQGDLTEQTLNTPLKPVHAKSQALAPEARATLKVLGSKGVDMDLKAIVNAEEELLVPDPDILAYPTIRPLGMTVHQMYPGCIVGTTLNLYSYYNGKNPGFSASASVAVFKANAERFGGGVDLDVNAIFLD